MNATPVQIVRADESDLPSIAALANVIWQTCYPGIISSAQIDYMLEKMYALETLRKEVRSGIVFERLLEGADLIGFAAHGRTEAAETVKLHKLYVHPAHQGRGLGRRLLRHCAAEAHRAGARRLILTVNKQNARAIAFYQQNDFSIVEAVVVDIGGGFVMDDYVMGKEVGESTTDERGRTRIER